MSKGQIESVLSQCELATEAVLQVLDDTLLSVSLFGNDDTQNKLVGNAPGLLFILADKSIETMRKLQLCTLPNGLKEQAHLLFFTPDELQSLEYESPLELLLIKTENSTLFGQDFTQSIDIKLNYLQGHIIRELRTVAIQLKSSLLRDDTQTYPSRIIASMNRLYISFKGILFLRGNSKFTGWSWLVSSIESHCSLKELTLSSVISALESRDESTLIELFLPFIVAIDHLLTTVSEMKIER